MGASQGGPIKEAVTLPVVWLPEADAKEARAWYDDVRPALGGQFALKGFDLKCSGGTISSSK